MLYRLAVQKLRAADDAFRQQLEAKELSHSGSIREIGEQYELRIAEQQHQVIIIITSGNSYMYPVYVYYTTNNKK